ncbi:MAG: hypothetical protein HYR90_02240 [Candidatus Andersenbacteria bacterium]|nr:hypothetical protein [Candidatus Andersenbacteria bacterium]MBI3250979.1 hypothetical protein [Candidatus Andersenbacteria bacterium]
MKEITVEEREQFFRFWMTQRRAIEGHLSAETLYWFNVYTTKENVGYEFGQLRPGKLGQWDLYWNLTGEQSVGCDENETLIASGLTAAEVAEDKRREHYRENCVNPDDPFEIAMFDRLQDMSPEQLEIEIARLETQLAKSE